MATETLRPTARVAPASGVTGQAGSGTATGGNVNPLQYCNASAVKTESNEWRAFAAAAHQVDWTSATLSVTWWIDPLPAVGQVGSGVCCSTKNVKLQYSTDGGSSWSNFSGWPKTASSSFQTGTASATLSTSVVVSNIRVRMIAESQSDGSCTGPLDLVDCGCQPLGNVGDIYVTAVYSTATGACCVSGVCSQKTQGNCSGTYKGDGTACSPNPCVTGACCSGASCSVKTPGNCSGTYKGDGTDCSPNPCSAVGGCCVASSCSSLTQSGCTTAGGSYYGDSTSCGVAIDGTSCATSCGGGTCCGENIAIQSNSCHCAGMGVPTRWREGVTVESGACSKARAIGGV